MWIEFLNFAILLRSTLEYSCWLFKPTVIKRNWWRLCLWTIWINIVIRGWEENNFGAFKYLQRKESRLKCEIHFWSLQHFNQNYVLSSHSIYVMYVRFYTKNLSCTILFTPRVFARNFLRESHQSNVCVSFCWKWLT